MSKRWAIALSSVPVVCLAACTRTVVIKESVSPSPAPASPTVIASPAIKKGDIGTCTLSGQEFDAAAWLGWAPVSSVPAAGDGIETCQWSGTGGFDARTGKPSTATLRIYMNTPKPTTQAPADRLAASEQQDCIDTSTAQPGVTALSYVCGFDLRTSASWKGLVYSDGHAALVEFDYNGDPTDWPGADVIKKAEGILLGHM